MGNSLAWTLQLLVWMFLSGATTTDFVRDASGDIRWDKPSEEVPAQTGPAAGTLLSYLRGAGVGCSIMGRVEWFT